MATTALIVGASQGIGLEFARQFLERVDQVYATYRTPDCDLSNLEHPNLVRLLLDITDEARIEEAIAKIKSETSELQYVINCVGVLHDGAMQPEKSLRHLNADQLVKYFQINSIGAALLAKHVQPLLKHRDRSILATISAKVGSISDNQIGGWYGYRASKAALNMFMRTTAIEFRRTCPNAIVVTLHPGTTDTRLSKPFQRSVPPEKLFSVDRTVGQLIAVIDKLQDSDSGEFFSWDGTKLPY
ncbi:SDR family NAD(P)-dependent oxidoreductase [Leptolyngbya sp. AN03gr2]|uniref:SDR family NAD(P)-dependent oxidoreductase n=1 Tax=unclassified Leptolyngbya TaxID=2650499 RepID=UPI003D31B491